MNRPNPSNKKSKRGGFLGALKSAFQKGLGLFSAKDDQAKHDRPTVKEMRLDANQYVVKRKLGRSFFTRQLTPGTRHKRIMSLTFDEQMLARDKGWIR